MEEHLASPLGGNDEDGDSGTSYGPTSHTTSTNLITGSGGGGGGGGVQHIGQPYMTGSGTQILNFQNYSSELDMLLKADAMNKKGTKKGKKYNRLNQVLEASHSGSSESIFAFDYSASDLFDRGGDDAVGGAGLGIDDDDDDEEEEESESSSCSDDYGDSSSDSSSESSDSNSNDNSNSDSSETSSPHPTTPPHTGPHQPHHSPIRIRRTLYIQMEYCQTTLRDYIDTKQLYASYADCVNLFRQILEGLAYIHKKGMLHRGMHVFRLFSL